MVVALCALQIHAKEQPREILGPRVGIRPRAFREKPNRGPCGVVEPIRRDQFPRDLVPWFAAPKGRLEIRLPGRVRDRLALVPFQQHHGPRLPHSPRESGP